jgi:hypothetical protein
MKTRISLLSSLPSVAMVVAIGGSYLSGVSFAPAGEYGNFRYSEFADRITITGYVFKPQNGIVIPATIYGDPVVAIGDYAFQDCNRITSVTIPAGVTKIGLAAFDGCGALTIATIPNTVTTIGNGAFLNCPNLETITIPDSVTEIGVSAFQYCHKLSSITIPFSVTTLGNNAFRGCMNLTSIGVAEGNPNYRSVDGVLFDKPMTTLIQYPTNRG